MNPGSLSPSDLARVEALLRLLTGLTFNAATRTSLPLVVRDAAESLRLPLDAYLARLFAREPDAVTALTDRAAVNETYFLRHPEHFELLEKVILPELGMPPSLTIWSAGCSTGEEPYSLAITLAEAGRAGADRIVATDLVERFLEVARRGVYGKWSMRRVPQRVIDTWFRSLGAMVELVPRVLAAVRFQQHNLVTDPPPVQDADLVFCRNVLIYFEPELALSIIESFVAALRPGGFLILGVAELPIANGLPLERVEYGGAVALRKIDPSKRAKTLRPAARPAPRAHPRSRSLAPLTPFERAQDAFRKGRLREAEAFAQEAAELQLLPEAFLLLGMTFEARGDLSAAVSAIRRSLYVDPGFAAGHATLATLLWRLGRSEEAVRARDHALRAVAELPDGAELKSVEPLTAGQLRRALSAIQ